MRCLPRPTGPRRGNRRVRARSLGVSAASGFRGTLSSVDTYCGPEVPKSHACTTPKEFRATRPHFRPSAPPPERPQPQNGPPPPLQPEKKVPPPPQGKPQNTYPLVHDLAVDGVPVAVTCGSGSPRPSPGRPPPHPAGRPSPPPQAPPPPPPANPPPRPPTTHPPQDPGRPPPSPPPPPPPPALPVPPPPPYYAHTALPPPAPLPPTSPPPPLITSPPPARPPPTLPFGPAVNEFQGGLLDLRTQNRAIEKLRWSCGRWPKPRPP